EVLVEDGAGAVVVRDGKQVVIALDPDGGASAWARDGSFVAAIGVALDLVTDGPDRLVVERRFPLAESDVAHDVLPAPPPGDVEGPAVAAIRAAVSELRGPVAEIRDRLVRTEVERLADEVRRLLYQKGFDGVTLLTDFASVSRTGESKVQVEVVREGVKSKG